MDSISRLFWCRSGYRSSLLQIQTSSSQFNIVSNRSRFPRRARPQNNNTINNMSRSRMRGESDTFQMIEKSSAIERTITTKGRTFCILSELNSELTLLITVRINPIEMKTTVIKAYMLIRSSRVTPKIIRVLREIFNHRQNIILAPQ